MYNVFINDSDEMRYSDKLHGSMTDLYARNSNINLGSKVSLDPAEKKVCWSKKVN